MRVSADQLRQMAKSSLREGRHGEARLQFEAAIKAALDSRPVQPSVACRAYLGLAQVQDALGLKAESEASLVHATEIIETENLVDTWLHGSLLDVIATLRMKDRNYIAA